MDLLSERSYSTKATSADVEQNSRDEVEKYKRNAFYYNHVIRNSKRTRGNPIKRYQTRLDGICNTTYEEKPSPPIRNNNNRNIMLINDGHDKDPRTINTTRNKLLVNKLVQSTDNNVETTITDSNHVTCTKYLPKIEVEPKLALVKSCNKYESFQHSNKDIARPAYVEKTTNCRPARNMYSQEFIFKTMERNARLQGLARRLILARERENQKVAWNNYIHELKNKYRNCFSELTSTQNYMPEDTNPEIIDDYFNTRFTCKQSNHCQNLLQDFYSASNETDTDNQKPKPYSFHNNRYFFPTSSQGRLMMLNQKRPEYYLSPQYHKRPANRYLYGTPIFVDKENGSPNNKRPRNKLLNFKKQKDIKSQSIQTNLHLNVFTDTNEHSTKETLNDKYNRVTQDGERLKQPTMQFQNEVKYCSLATIEEKLDALIKSINTFIVTIKSQRILTNTNCAAVSCQKSDSPPNTPKSDTIGVLQREQLMCGLVQERPRSTLPFNEGKYHDTIDGILYEEMHKSNKVKRDIEEILNTSSNSDHPSVHITFDVPTKERPTEIEIKDSLIKTKHSSVVVKENDRQTDQQMTIAVNTDPLSLLSLFRMSTETVKQILSYMPHIDYYSYLSRLPLPQPTRNEMSPYVCNICGAAFARPSQLSDHIEGHNLDNSR